jgi:hypothetical protein
MPRIALAAAHPSCSILILDCGSAGSSEEWARVRMSVGDQPASGECIAWFSEQLAVRGVRIVSARRRNTWDD